MKNKKKKKQNIIVVAFSLMKMKQNIQTYTKNLYNFSVYSTQQKYYKTTTMIRICCLKQTRKNIKTNE